MPTKKPSSIAIAASVVVVIVSVFAVLLAAQPGQQIERLEGNRSSEQSARVRVLISTRPDAPLGLQITHSESAGVDQYIPEVEVVITNPSNKVVSAYAIRHDVGLKGQLRPGGVRLIRARAARSLLRPGDAQTVSIGGTRYSLPIERLVVSIDFLEFTDGTTWGADTYSSREVLTGMRAGEEATARYLLGLLTAQGPTTFARELERADDDSSIPLGESPKWREGFQRGMAFIRARVKHEARDFSATEIERALTQPIDALDEIKRSAR